MYVLIPAREAYNACRAIRILPFLWAATWELLVKETPEDKIIRVHRILTKKTDEDIRESIDRFCADMTSVGFMIEEPQEKS